MAVDLFCGLGGWTEGLLAEGWDVIGFDNERHEYWMPKTDERSAGMKTGTCNWEDHGKPGHVGEQMQDRAMRELGWSADSPKHLVRYPAQLVLQDVLTLHGKQFRDAGLIVASPPCQEYSYMAMPWSRAKAIAAEYRSGVRDVRDLTRLFDACFRVQREACEAAGRHIPMVVENVRGAIPWVGRSRWNFGSFHLWGDVPALMPMTKQRRLFSERAASTPEEAHALHYRMPVEHTKNDGGSWFAIGSPGQKETGRNPVNRPSVNDTGLKQGGDWFNASQPSISRMTGSKSNARKAASAAIAKIPFALSSHIARVYRA